MRYWSNGARAAFCAIVICVAAPAVADECPTGKSTFFIERGGSRTEVVHSSGPIFQTILYYREQKLAETTLYEGLFELDRVDRGRRWVLKPKANLAKFFPLKVGQKIDVGFDVQQDRTASGSSRVKLNVIGRDTISIGSCKYDILKIDRDETGARLFQNIDYYAPALRMIVAKEHKESDGRSTVIRFTRIYEAAAR
jgi:hypothetical protein